MNFDLNLRPDQAQVVLLAGTDQLVDPVLEGRSGSTLSTLYNLDSAADGAIDS